jgi:hypothetical protein
MPFLDTADIAKDLHITRRTVHEYRVKYGLPMRKIGRRYLISLEDYKRWLSRFGLKGGNDYSPSQRSD